MKMIKTFLRDESGMETLEYAVIAGLIAAVLSWFMPAAGAMPSKPDSRGQQPLADQVVRENGGSLARYDPLHILLKARNVFET